MTFRQITPAKGLRSDLIITVLPVVWASSKLVPAKVTALGLAALVVLAFLRKSDVRHPVQTGPLMLLFASFAIVFVRPQPNFIALTFLTLVGTLILILVSRVDGRVFIGSFIDGWGLFLLVNVLAHAAGIRAAQAPGVVRQTTDFVRITFPLTSGWNSPAIIAGAYLVAAIFLIREGGWLKRSLRLAYAASAILIFIGTGTRGALVVSIVLAAVAIWLPTAGRWIGQATTLVAATSALVLPTVIAWIAFVVQPLTALTPGRGRITSTEAITTLQGRVEIWDGSITYWKVWVKEVPEMLLGFGPNGQYTSGASLTYKAVVAGLRSDPEYSTLHNAFLQQVFDGGIVGWLLLLIAVYWASTRLSDRRGAWGPWALSAIFALTSLLLGSMTESQMAPGVLQESFWMLFGLVGIACQVSTEETGSTRVTKTAATATEQMPTSSRIAEV